MAPKGSASGSLWLQVNKDVFLNDLFAPFKDEHYKEEDYRKLSDKLRLMKKEAKKMMEGGNKSRLPGGELSEKFKLIQQVIDEGDRAEQERQLKKDGDDAERKLIQDTGDRIMNGNVPKRDKGKLIVHLDGTVSDHRIKKRANLFEDYIIKKMSNESKGVDEAEIEKKIARWIFDHNKFVTDLTEDVDISLIPSAEVKGQVETALRMIEAIGLGCILSMYCQNGKKFSLSSFAESMGLMSVNYFASVKVHHVLEKWRAFAIEYANDENLQNAGPSSATEGSDESLVII